MNRILILFQVLLLAAVNIQGQKITSLGSTKTVEIGDRSYPFFANEERLKTTTNQYLYSDWKAGNIVTQDSSILSNMAFKYDIVNDRMEVKSILNPQLIDKITLGKQFFIYSDYNIDAFSYSGYFELLLDGKVKLLMRRKVKLFPGKKGAYSFDSHRTISKDYFIKYKDEPAILISDDESIVLKRLSDKAEQINSFIERNNLKMKRTNDILLLLAYYNTLE